jgi:hypothetical protein
VSSLHFPSTTRRPTRSRRVRAGLATAAVLVATVPLAAACGAGFTDAAQQVKPNSGAGSVDSLKVNNVWVVVDPTTGNGEVIGAVANSGDNAAALQSVAVDGASGQFFNAVNASPGAGTQIPPGGVSIAAGDSVSFGEADQPLIELPATTLTPGNLAQVTFSFGDTGTVTTTAQIQSNTGLWANYNPNAALALLTPSPSPSLSLSPSATATAGPTASASATSSVHTKARPSASATASPSSS